MQGVGDGVTIPDIVNWTFRIMDSVDMHLMASAKIIFLDVPYANAGLCVRRTPTSCSAQHTNKSRKENIPQHIFIYLSTILCIGRA